MKSYVLLFVALSEDFGRNFCSVISNEMLFEALESLRVELCNGSVLMK